MSDLQQALTAIMAEVGYVQKDAKNSFHKYKYASADAVLTKVREACQKHGVAIVESRSELIEYQVGEDAKGKPQRNAVVRLTQTYAKGDETAMFQGTGEGSDPGDKATMKANTAALKYLLSNAFNISWGDDPEDDRSTDEASSGDAKKKRPSARRGKGPRVDKDTVLKRIKEVKTRQDLEKLKPDVADGRKKGEPEYKMLVKAWKKRDDELKGD